MEKVSVIIPVYNVEEYLEECLDSVVRQTQKSLEIICVDDGSEDGSPEILAAYAARDPRIKVIRQENQGYGKAMNVGLLAASGEYIGIVEPDDYVGLSMFGDLYEIAKEHDLDFVKADFYRFMNRGDGRDLYYVRLSEEPDKYNVVFDPSRTPAALNYVMNTWSGIYRRAFLMENQILHNETPGASYQDNGFFFQTFVRAKKAMIVPKPYYRNRRDNPNSSMINREKLYCIDEEYDYIRELLSEDSETWFRFRAMYWKKRYDNYDSTLKRISPAFKKEYMEHLHKMLKKASDLRELDLSVFPPYSQNMVRRILNDHKSHYLESLLEDPEYAKITQTAAYKVYERLNDIPGYAVKDGKKLLKKARKAIGKKT